MKKAAKKEAVIFIINIDMKWSEDIHVKARTAGEAKAKAWKKFKSRLPRKNFDISADKY